MADYNDTKTLKQLALNQGRFLAARGAYNNIENEPDDSEANSLRKQCQALTAELLKKNEALNARCFELALLIEEHKDDPADDLFNEEDTADQALRVAAAQARLEGAQAYGKGQDIDDCPYDESDPLRAHWLAGWNKAEEEFEGGE